MILFRILFGIDALAALVFLYFFVIGVGDGSVSSFNIQLWLIILLGVAAVLVGGFILNSKGSRAAANALVAVLAVPAILFALFMLTIILTNPRWN